MQLTSCTYVLGILYEVFCEKDAFGHGRKFRRMTKNILIIRAAEINDKLID